MLFNDITPGNYFITATDTGVGKTFITSELGRYFQSLGYQTGAMKPFSSGGREDPVILKKVMKQGDELDLLNPVWFEQPLAPYACLLEEGLRDKGPEGLSRMRNAECPEFGMGNAECGIEIQNPKFRNPKSEIRKEESINKIKSAYTELSSKYDILLVEGIGGALVPLWKDYYVADLIKEMELPALIIARAGLGTLNHTLMTIEVLKKRNISIAGIILNGFTGQDISERKNRQVIEEMSRIRVLAEVPLH
ncbi:dethiobiotin synthase [Candidatus Margulisiibacteriota bacterium]